MKIDENTIKKVEEISKLKVDAEREKELSNDLMEIINVFSIIQEADVNGVESSFIPIDIENTLREDEAKVFGEDPTSLAEFKEEGFIIGPRTTE